MQRARTDPLTCRRPLCLADLMAAVEEGDWSERGLIGNRLAAFSDLPTLDVRVFRLIEVDSSSVCGTPSRSRGSADLNSVPQQMTSPGVSKGYRANSLWWEYAPTPAAEHPC
jgi:hypothetical protein